MKRSYLFLTFKYVSAFFVISICFVFGAIYASTGCMVCSKTPMSLHQYIEFGYEVIGALQPQAPEKSFGDPKGVFSEGDLGDKLATKEDEDGNKTAFGAGIAGFKRNMQRKLQGFTTTALIFSRLTFSLDTARSLRVVIRGTTPMVRDFRKLLELENLISEKTQEFGFNGTYRTKIPKDQQDAIKDIAKRYQGSGKLFSSGTSFVFKKNARYGQILSLFRVLTQKHKSFVAFDSISQFQKNDDVKKLTKGNVSIVYGTNYGDTLQTQYACARKIGVCEQGITQFVDNMEDLFELTKGDVIDNVKEMQSAMVRLQKSLQGAFIDRDKTRSKVCQRQQCKGDLKKKGLCKPGVELRFTKIDDEETYFYKIGGISSAPKRVQIQGGEETTIPEPKVYDICNFYTREMGSDPASKQQIDDFLRRENELLHTQFDIHTSQANIDSSVWGKMGKMMSRETWQKVNIKEKTITVAKNIADGVKKPITKVGEMIHNIKERSQQKDVIKEIFDEQNLTFDQNKYEELKNFEMNLLVGIHQTMTDHTDALGQATLADTRDITQSIGAIVQKVRYMTHMIKDKDNPSSIVNNLGRACEGQCGNLGGKCWSE